MSLAGMVHDIELQVYSLSVMNDGHTLYVHVSVEELIGVNNVLSTNVWHWMCLPLGNVALYT